MSFRLPTSSLPRRTDAAVQPVRSRLGRGTSKLGSQWPSRRPVRTRARRFPAGDGRWWRGGWGIAALLAPGSALAQVTNRALGSPAAPVGLPDAGLSLLRVLGALALVVALFLFGVWAYRHWQRITLYRGRAPKLALLEVRPLGNRSALYVVGYERERFLVASSPVGTQLLTRLPPSEGEAGATAPPDFLHRLQEASGSAQASVG